MNVEIILIGDELITGANVDTNSAYISTQCEFAGFNVIRHTTIGDNLSLITEAFSESSSRADIVLVSGGLGPTLDDLTRDAAAKTVDVPLVLNQEILTSIENYFQQRGRTMPETNKRQAYFPKIAEPIINPLGTAPGFMLSIKNTDFFFMPGVPREMKLMLKEKILPMLQEKYRGQLQPLTHHTISTFGVSEATIGEHLEKIEPHFSDIKFGTRAKFPEMQIKMYARGEQRDKLIEEAAKLIRSDFNACIYSESDKAMQEIVIENLIQTQKTLSILECNHGGLITEHLFRVENSEKCIDYAAVINLKNILTMFNLSEDPLEKLLPNISNKLRVLTNSTYNIVIHTDFKTGDFLLAMATPNDLTLYNAEVPLRDSFLKNAYFSMLALDLVRRNLLKLPPPKAILEKPLVITFVNTNI